METFVLQQLKDLTVFMAKSLVDDPESVTVEAVEGDKTIIIELTVSETDLGKVIGKDGRTARAMRTLLSATSARSGMRSILEILE